MLSIDERQTERFIRWAFHGQGLELWDAPVSPEPVFRPFPSHHLPLETAVDDGRRPTVVSSWIRTMSNGLRGAAPPQPPVLEEEEPLPDRLERDDLAEIEVMLGADQTFRSEEYGYLFTSFHGCREPVAIELIASAKGIKVQFAAHRADIPLIKGQLESFFPSCSFLAANDTLRDMWETGSGDCRAVVDFGLAHEFMLPLATPKLDPYVSLVGALGEIDEGELSVYQVIFRPVRHRWAESTLRSVSDAAGDAFFANAPELLDGAKRKVASPLFAAVIRLGLSCESEYRANEIVGNVAGALRVFEEIEGNRLVPLDNGEYPDEAHVEDLLRRQSRRSGMIVNALELAALAHIPSGDIESPRLIRDAKKTKAAPTMLADSRGLYLGDNAHAGKTAPVFLSPAARMRHVHLIGASGTGKSTLLYRLIRADVEAGRGVAVLDPHGDLVDSILGAVPVNRIQDVVLLDPSDIEYPVGFNVLRAHSELEKTLLASDLVSVFQRLSTSWGDQMGSVMSQAVLAFLESERGGTLSDLRRFLLEPAFRASFLETVRDPEVVYYWKNAFPQLSGGKSIGPILTRLETFLAPKSIRYMVSQKANRLDFAGILDGGKIFLAKLAQGAIGKENSYLLGTLLVSKFEQLAMARQAQAESLRRDFYLYIDEFHNFITPSMAEILSGARKYRLGLVLAHQELRQLERDREVSSAVLSNAYTRICFRVGDDDARKLEAGFSYFGAKDLQNLGTGEAICRVERSDFDFNLTVPRPEYPDDGAAAERRREVVEASRKAYGRPRSEVEAELAQARQSAAPEPRHAPVPSAPTAAPLPRRAEAPPVPAPEAAPPEAKPVLQLPPTAPAPIATVPQPKPTPPVNPATPGRGGREHKYLQQFVKQWAEGMGWKTTIEAPVPGGAGSVDILLAKAGVSIACEISVTTSVEHEVSNLTKCALGSFTHVVSVCADEKKSRDIRIAAARSLPPDQLEQIRFFTPADLFAFVGEIDAKSASKETTVKGYKVKVNYRPLSRDDSTERMERVAKVVSKSLKRLRKDTNP